MHARMQPRLPARPPAPGSLPTLCASDLMMGTKMPPARAEVDGMAGAMSASATLSP